MRNLEYTEFKYEENKRIREALFNRASKFLNKEDFFIRNFISDGFSKEASQLVFRYKARKHIKCRYYPECGHNICQNSEVLKIGSKEYGIANVDYSYFAKGLVLGIMSDVLETSLDIDPGYKGEDPSKNVNKLFISQINEINNLDIQSLYAEKGVDAEKEISKEELYFYRKTGLKT